MKTATRHLVILLVALFTFNLNLKADKETIPIEGEFKTVGVRSTINIPPVEASFDQDFLYLDFQRSFSSLTVLIIDENNNTIIDEIYVDPQSEIISLDSLLAGRYRMELHANGRMMWGWFLIR